MTQCYVICVLERADGRSICIASFRCCETILFTMTVLAHAKLPSYFRSRAYPNFQIRVNVNLGTIATTNHHGHVSLV